jgi:hypothetical protein
MPVIMLKSVEGEPFEMQLPPDAVKHCSYIRGLLDAAPDGDATIEVPHTNAELIKFICEFHEQHKNDPEVEVGIFTATDPQDGRR